MEETFKESSHTVKSIPCKLLNATKHNSPCHWAGGGGDTATDAEGDALCLPVFGEQFLGAVGLCARLALVPLDMPPLLCPPPSVCPGAFGVTFW